MEHISKTILEVMSDLKTKSESVNLLNLYAVLDMSESDWDSLVKLFPNERDRFLIAKFTAQNIKILYASIEDDLAELNKLIN